MNNKTITGFGFRIIIRRIMQISEGEIMHNSSYHTQHHSKVAKYLKYATLKNPSETLKDKRYLPSCDNVKSTQGRFCVQRF